MNHNLKLVKLKKVKKVYTNLPDDAQAENELSKKPTIVDLDAKYNVITQTPIPFLILEKPAEQFRDDHFDLIRRKDLITERELREKIFKSNNVRADPFGEKHLGSNPDKSAADLPARPNFNLFQHEDKKSAQPSKTILLNGKLIKAPDRRNDLNDANVENEISLKGKNDERSKSIKVLFPSGNKFKLSHFKSNPSNRSASFYPFASASNKSTARTEFLNKITTRSKPKLTTTTTVRPTLTTRHSLKADKSNVYTTETPKSFTLKPTKRTTTFRPYIYTAVSVTTSEPVLRIRKGRPTSVQTKATTPSSHPSPVDKKPKIENELRYEHKPTIDSLSLDVERPDLESNNSNRKYAKLFFDKDKPEKKKDEKRIEKADENKLIKESKPSTTTARSTSQPVTRSYWRPNSRPPYTSHFTTQRPVITSSFSPSHPSTYSPSYLPSHSPPYEKITNSPTRVGYQTTTQKTEESRRHDTTTQGSIRRSPMVTTTESILKNEINRDKVLTAIRKRPIYRPRRVTLTQLTQLTTVRPTTEKPATTTEPSLRLTTVYSARFRSTTIYRSTTESRIESPTESSTESSVSDRFTTRFRYAATPAFTTASYRETNKETSFYQPKSRPEDQPTDSSLSTSNDLMSNFIPRRSKWVLKGTRQRKSDQTSKEELTTRPIHSSRSNPSVYSTAKPTTRSPYSATTTESSVEPITRRAFATTTPNAISKLPVAYKTIDRTPKSVASKKPKSFFAPEKEVRKESELNDLENEPPKRERNTQVDLNLIDPDREIHYQDVKVRKESKLVPQTYLYSTSAPATVARLNERLSHLNEEKAKYQLPYPRNNDGRIETYPRTAEEERSKYWEEDEIRPRYPDSIPYVPKKKPLTYSSSQSPYSPKPYSPETYSSYSPEYPKSRYESRPSSLAHKEPTGEDKPTTVQPFVRSHFNLGPPSQDHVPKYGPIFKHVGKLSEAFHNQAPIPYFSPEISKELDAKEPPESRLKESPYKENSYKEEKEPYDRYREPIRYPLNEQQNYNIDLKRYPVSKEPATTSQPNEPDRYRVNSETVKPFDFAHYKPLPNYKFIRTDLESNEIPESKYKDPGRPLIEVDKPVVERRPNTETRPVLERPVLERPVLNNYYTNDQPDYHPNYIDSNHLDRPTAPTEKPTRFNFNRIPAKVVYDKYNKKFTGRINLKKANFVPTAKHYADIPKHVQPIEYQARPTESSVGPTVRNRPTYKPVYKPVYNPIPKPIHKPIYKSPVANKPAQTKPLDNSYERPVQNNKPVYKPAYQPVYNKPINHKPISNRPVNNMPINTNPIKPLHQNHYQPNNDYNRYRQEVPVFQIQPVDRPIIDQRPQFVSHFNPSNNPKDVRPNEYQQAPRTNSRPSQFYSERPANFVNRPQNNQPNRFNNQFNYEPPKNQFNRPNDDLRFAYRQPNRTPFNGQNNQIGGQFRPNQPSNPNNQANMFGYHQPNANQFNKFNQFGAFNEKPPFRREINKYPQTKPPYNSQFDNAGHYDHNYDFSDSDKVIPLQPNNKDDLELIDLNDLSLFNGKMPDFKLLQKTVISHDIPTYKYLR